MKKVKTGRGFAGFTGNFSRTRPGGDISSFNLPMRFFHIVAG
jgi:hypothetical protein